MCELVIKGSYYGEKLMNLWKISILETKAFLCKINVCVCVCVFGVCFEGVGWYRHEPFFEYEMEA